MKSETCNGSFKGEAPRVADPFDQKLLSGKSVKSEPPKEFKRKSPVDVPTCMELPSGKT